MMIIISLISYQVYLTWNKKKIETISEQYFQALEELENKNYSKGLSLFLNNSQKHNSGYRILSLFGLAELNHQNGKTDEMIINYKIKNKIVLCKFKKICNSTKNNYNNKKKIIKNIILHKFRFIMFIVIYSSKYLF